MDDEADQDQRFIEPDFRLKLARTTVSTRTTTEKACSWPPPTSPESTRTRQSPTDRLRVPRRLRATRPGRASFRIFSHRPWSTKVWKPSHEHHAPRYCKHIKPHPLRVLLQDRRSRVVRLPTLQRAPEEQPAVQGRLSGKRANKNTKSKYQNFSNRLGGGDLTELRDTIGAKRGLEEDKEMLEASYAKARRIRTVNATTALKTKLAGLENATNSMGGSFMETILLLREENERKAEDRRAEEEQRRRDDIAAR
ncbi:hypothetical protein PF010_g10891 [Phytophthora fragariae]|uniref:Uncharacterized protein n=1 Tax=Phytophthora fragariae TaxID=53985 RepID=A0A6A3SGK7_9STRA|nr:hypothetical protein PF003_g28925 [Phytophthora fragariae]KAE9111226.1 hypothetical protein PF010_g10891 [Phytophthora fragariae]KAE9113092.1 hypothetical protein PF007_g10853 [Phytophthora fragariae]KAE9312840.1 hypothetical protein PF001_g9028 [Phytophthora fragariae]